MGPLDEIITASGRPFLCGDLFDGIPDTVFFVKDAGGRYAAANLVLARRTGFQHGDALLGLRADEVFPGELGRRISRQDRSILDGARSIRGELELHLYANGEEGWCLTWKEVLRDRGGKVIGLVGLSRDVRGFDHTSAETEALSRALQQARLRPDLTTKVGDLASAAGLSPFQLDQRTRIMFGLSAGQFLTRLRLDQASESLRTSGETLSQIALDCGYADQSAFAKQFRKTVGVSPGQYRRMRASS